MKRITESEYNARHPDFRGVWSTERYDEANWEEVRHLYMGKRTMTDYDDRYGTVLLIEGLSLEIVPDSEDCPRCNRCDSTPANHLSHGVLRYCDHCWELRGKHD